MSGGEGDEAEEGKLEEFRSEVHWRWKTENPSKSRRLEMELQWQSLFHSTLYNMWELPSRSILGFAVLETIIREVVSRPTWSPQSNTSERRIRVYLIFSELIHGECSPRPFNARQLDGEVRRNKPSKGHSFIQGILNNSIQSSNYG